VVEDFDKLKRFNVEQLYEQYQSEHADLAKQDLDFSNNLQGNQPSMTGENSMPIEPALEETDE
jgi:hypothetical protein